MDLEPRLRCRGCDAKGKAMVSVRWGGGTMTGRARADKSGTVCCPTFNER